MRLCVCRAQVEAEADEIYCAAIDKVTSVFGKQKRSQTTADEHKSYVRMFDGWLVRQVTSWRGDKVTR